jgi:hypothetical protein
MDTKKEVAVQISKRRLRKKHEIQLNFTAQVKGGKKHHNYYLSSGHSLVLAFVGVGKVD